VLALLPAGCGGPRAAPDLVWGRHGVQDGDISKPRAIAIDAQDRVFVVDFTARIQVYDRDGKYLGPTWTTPDFRNGRPSGLGIDRDGNLIVSDSHYHCFRIYDAQGRELRKFGGEAGTAPGQLDYFVAEFGENHRISVFDSAGRFLRCWGCEGTEPGQVSRIRALALGPDGNLYVADANNHRIQIFSKAGRLVACWGEPGREPGQLTYPYDLAFGPDGNLYVVEFGNGRVQKFTPQGRSLGCWGAPGHKPGQLANPWALAVDSRGRVHVVDTGNHRIQRIAF
jgi:DNA-binding beta-propeller fold protein YncE